MIVRVGPRRFCKGPNTIAYDSKLVAGMSDLTRAGNCRDVCAKDERCTGAYFDASTRNCHLFGVNTLGWTGGQGAGADDQRDSECFIKQGCKAKYRYEIITGDDPNVQRCTDIRVSSTRARGYRYLLCKANMSTQESCAKAHTHGGTKPALAVHVGGWVGGCLFECARA